MVASFVLTYYDDATITRRTDEASLPSAKQHKTGRNEFNAKRAELEKLKGKKGQLVMFLTGHGGAGKSHVITSIRQYAKQFCTNLGVHFDRRTIVLTALSGVAAISIHGETIHTAAGFQRKINSDMIKQWKNARLLIVDEVSFMSESELMKLQKCLCQLLEQPATRHFGGINIVFFAVIFASSKHHAPHLFTG